MMRYKPELDGLRAISILLVIVSHAGFSQIIPGGFGVTVFFFVSGYLITSLLINEYEMHGKINLSQFYLRRFWRLLPPMFFFLVLSTVLIFIVNHHIVISELLACVFYIANYFKLLVHFENVGGLPSPYNILWSLAIEEHFYILFAPLIAFTFKSNFYAKIVAAFLIFPLIIRLAIIWLYPEMLREEGYIYFATETRIDSIAFGCFLAYIFSKNNYPCLRKVLLNPFLLWPALLLLISTFLLRNLYLRETFRYTFQSVALLVIIANLIYGNSLFIHSIKKFLSDSSMVFIGKLSYSLYLQHWLALTIISLWIGQKGIYLSWQLGYWTLTILLSLFSYFVIERPTIRLRRRYGSNV